MSSTSSGEAFYDSTGLRAKQELNTPLLRCASPVKHTASLARFRDDTAKIKGEAAWLPLLHLRFEYSISWGDETLSGDGGDAGTCDGLGDAGRRKMQPWFEARQWPPVWIAEPLFEIAESPKPALAPTPALLEIVCTSLQIPRSNLDSLCSD